MQLGLVVASKGRPECFLHIVKSIERQDVKPTHVVFSVTAEEDLPKDVEEICENSDLNIRIVKGDVGATFQRNAGLKLIKAQVDIVLYIDDDFLMAHDWVKNCCFLFEQYPDVVGLTGYLAKDGAIIGSLSWDDSYKILHEHEGVERDFNDYTQVERTYGCNMAFRISAIGDEVFDEKLPLYSWLEDRDFSLRVGRQGRIIKSAALYGVHLGISSGRVSGVRFGYSQIANPYYLYKKDVISLAEALELMGRPFLKNLYKSINPELTIDRRGRAKGNFMAFKDLIFGRSDPGRILSIS